MNPIYLDGQWTLTSLTDSKIQTSLTIPGDVHSALFDANIIPDPYWATHEDAVQWVHTHEWCIEKRFNLTADDLNCREMDLCLNQVDTYASIEINGNLVAQVCHQFLAHQFEILSFLNEGENVIRIQFHPVDQLAKERAEALPFPVPWAVGNNHIPHMNMVRKTQCHAGWDWGICLLVSGIYDSVYLRPVQTHRLLGCQTEQIWSGDACRLNIALDVETASEDFVSPEIEGELIAPTGEVYPLQIQPLAYHAFYVELENPQRWWPAGYGEQPLYQLNIRLDGQVIEKKIGFRELRLDTSVDDIGSAMTFVVNGRPIMAKGANWIPVDALPSRHTKERYQKLLQDAKAANMNMIRVWGGGMYEQDIFYELCDALGLLIWQDFMFACALYPSTPDFISEVQAEVRHQVRRLKDHPSIALWCGDNEVIGAISWYPESKNNREKYVVNYDRLNRAIEQIVAIEDPARRFWSSSPCNGELDYGDAWHDDNKGDMHFWDVWHSGKSFDAYQSIQPRFCSEFGYQSWPSLPSVKSFAPEIDWNITSPSFEKHQKNQRGNSIITEMFTRYFRFPMSFEQMLYLSQVQQAIAIKTASEYWRAQKPVCRGILYWQLNDCWPVSSWSSIEYSGRWKQLHYHAKRFFAPKTAVLMLGDESLNLHLLNDEFDQAKVEGQITWFDWQGEVRQRWDIQTEIGADANEIIWRVPRDRVEANKAQGFFHVQVQVGDHQIENTWFADVFKKLPLQRASIQTQVIIDHGKIYVECSTDRPAFFVHLESTLEGRFEDSSFTLLPHQSKRIEWLGESPQEVADFNLKVYQLAEV